MKVFKQNYCPPGKVMTAILVLMLALALGGCAKDKTPEIWGRADAKEVDINSKVPGRVTEVLVKEGQEVRKGELLARIDSRELKAKADQARAASQAAAVQAAQAGTMTKLQDRATEAAVESAAKQVEKAAADLALARKNYSRFSALQQAGAVSALAADEAKLRLEVASANYSQSLAALETAKANLLQQQMSRDNEQASANRAAQAEAAAAEVGVLLDETEIRSPIDGIVTGKMVEPGELVSTGSPILTIQDPRDNWVNIKIMETELDKYKLNEQVNLMGQNKDLKLTGTIVDISKKPEFATYRATNERNSYDIITYNVKIQVNSEQVRPGMKLKVVGGVI